MKRTHSPSPFRQGLFSRDVSGAEVKEVQSTEETLAKALARRNMEEPVELVPDNGPQKSVEVLKNLLRHLMLLGDGQNPAGYLPSPLTGLTAEYLGNSFNSDSQITLCEHTHALCALEGGGMASAAFAKEPIKIWDLSNGGEAVLSLPGHEGGSVRSVCGLPDGGLASGSLDATISVWDWRGGKQRAAKTLSGHVGAVRCLCALDGGRLASGSDDSTVRVWELGTDTPRGPAQTLVGHKMRVSSVCEAGAGHLLASGSWDKTIRIWDLREESGFELQQTLVGHRHLVLSVCWTVRGLASGSQDGTIRIWDLGADGKYECVQTLTEHVLPVTCLCVLHDGRLASGSHDGTVKVWELGTGGRWRSAETLQGHTKHVKTICALTCGRLASGSGDGTIRIWN